MAYQLVILPQAEADIAEAFTYLAEHSPQAAGRWYRLVREAIESLAEMPARCPLAPETVKLGFEIRQLLYGQRRGLYRIAFRIVEDVQEVHVLAVRHGARKPLTEEEMQFFLDL